MQDAEKKLESTPPAGPNWAVIIIPVFLLAAFCTAMVETGKTTTETPADRRARICGKGGESDAVYMAQEFVTDRLKAPSTADFPRRLQSAVYGKDCTFIITGMVDAQNSFGAMIRSTYVGTLEYSPEADSWTVKDLLID